MTKISLEDEITLTTTRTLHKLFSYKNGSDAVGLYNFYMYTAKWQKTNQIKASPAYCMKGLGWGKERFGNAQRVLKEEKLIEIIKKRGKDGKIEGWYMKINYIWKQEKAEKVELILKRKEIPVKQAKVATIPSNQIVDEPDCGKQTTNALSANKPNSLSANNETIYTEFSKNSETENFENWIFTEKKAEDGEFLKHYFSSVKEFNEFLDGMYAEIKPFTKNWRELRNSEEDNSALMWLLQQPKIGLKNTKKALEFKYKRKIEMIDDTYGHPYMPKIHSFSQLKDKYDPLLDYSFGLQDDTAYQKALARVEREEEKY